MDLFWMTALQQRLKHYSAVILFGNNHDRFPVGDGEWATLDEAICMAARNCSMVADGTSRIDALRQLTDDFSSVFDENMLVDRTDPTCFRVLNAQMAFPRTSGWVHADWRAHGALVNNWLQNDKAGAHRFVFVFPSAGLIPPGFLYDVPGVARLEVTAPEFKDRHELFTARFSTDSDSDRRRMAGLTEGMNWLDLRRMADTAPAASPEARQAHVRDVRFGVRKDDWGQLRADPSRLRDAANKITGGDDPLVGQQEAVDKCVRVLAGASFDMSALTGPDYRRPRGVLFFVGPTGVGKTMLAKKLAEVIFGSADSCIVFDMSEYGTSHSEARLIGSPPGYVGHDEGGQLTTAVRRRPFSLLLFDEIDKADPSILLKFLQILEEGRLTDGKGQTALFSETLIVFTSNRCAEFLGDREGHITVSHKALGNRQIAVPARDASYDQLTMFYREALQTTEEIFVDHPEILNRIGLTNIIPFRHFADPNNAKMKVRSLLDSTKRFFANERIDVLVRGQEDVIDHLVKRSQFEKMGLRNVQQQFRAEILDRLGYEAATADRVNAPLQISVRVENGQIVVARA